jgi:hypothetical protein
MGVAHVSCLAEQAKILCDEAEENNFVGTERFDERWKRWYSCGMCKQKYHGAVGCAFGWACWKTYLGRPEADWPRINAMTVLGNGLHEAEHHEDALSVREADLAMKRRVGAPEEVILVVLGNIANSYETLGRNEEALQIDRDVYSLRLKLHGEEHEMTLIAANNYASSLGRLRLFEEAKSLLRKAMPVARRVFGEGHELTLDMGSTHAVALYEDPAATLDNLREAVTRLEDTARIARRVFGGMHPLTVRIEAALLKARATIRRHGQ